MSTSTSPSYALPVTDGFLDQPEQFIHEAMKDMLEHFVDADERVDYARVALHVFTKLPERYLRSGLPNSFFQSLWPEVPRPQDRALAFQPT